MTRAEQFSAQFNYCAALSIANRMLAENLLTRQEYGSIKKTLIQHYNPPIKLLGVEPPKKALKIEFAVSEVNANANKQN